MNLKVTIEDNKYMERFFKEFHQYEEEIRKNMHHTLPEIIENRPHKIKPAYHLKRDGHTILEYRVIVKDRDFRAAYTQVGDEINVFFISKTLVKRYFVNQLAGTSLVD